MFLGMQDFDFAQIHSKLPKSHICPNLINFAPLSPQKNCQEMRLHPQLLWHCCNSTFNLLFYLLNCVEACNELVDAIFATQRQISKTRHETVLAKYS